MQGIERETNRLKHATQANAWDRACLEANALRIGQAYERAEHARNAADRNRTVMRRRLAGEGYTYTRRTQDEARSIQRARIESARRSQIEARKDARVHREIARLRAENAELASRTPIAPVQAIEAIDLGQLARDYARVERVRVEQ